MGGPLAGVLVVATEQAIAAPFCTRHLADMGARVIKVEPLEGGDFARAYDDVVRGMGSQFIWLNRNKESVTLDLKDPRGAEAMRRLLSRADAFVQNLAPGAAHRLGLSAARLTAEYPRMVAVDISGYGTGGPLDHKRAYDLLVQAEGGSCAITGWPGRPAKPGIPLADIGTGMYAASSIVAALFERFRTGRGAAVSVALFDVVTEWMGWALNYTRYSGHERPPNGASSPVVAPYGTYPTKDRQLLVVGTTNDREWQRLATAVLGRHDLAADPAYATNQDRIGHRAFLDEVLGGWAAGVTLAEAQRTLDEAGIGNARLNSVTEVLDHPQLVERDRWREVGTPVGSVQALLPPPVSSTWDARVDPVPGLGEQTEAVLAELGYTAAEITDLRASGVA